MSIPRRKLLSEEKRKLQNAAPPSFAMKRISEISGLDGSLQTDSLPPTANPAPKFLTPVAVLGYLLRAPIWIRERKNRGTVVVGNIDSWILAKSALQPDESVPVLQFGRSSNWFAHGLDLEHWLIPLLRAPNKKQMDQLLLAIAESDNDTLIELERINPSTLADLTGMGREAATKRLSPARTTDGTD